MFDAIPGHDEWKTTPPAERELGRAIQPGDPCMCGHDFDEHAGADRKCWKCPDLDQVCDGFEVDLDEVEDRARADYENMEFERGGDQWENN